MDKRSGQGDDLRLLHTVAPAVVLQPDGLTRTEPAKGVDALLGELAMHREQYGRASLDTARVVASAYDAQHGVAFFVHASSLKDVGGRPGRPATFRISRGHRVSVAEVDNAGRVSRLWTRRPLTHEEREARLRDAVHCYPAAWPSDTFRQEPLVGPEQRGAAEAAVKAWAAAHCSGSLDKLGDVLTDSCRLLDGYGITAPAVRPPPGQRRYLKGRDEIVAGLQAVHAKYDTRCEVLHMALADDSNVAFCQWRAHLIPRGPHPWAVTAPARPATAAVAATSPSTATAMGGTHPLTTVPPPPPPPPSAPTSSTSRPMPSAPSSGPRTTGSAGPAPQASTSPVSAATNVSLPALGGNGAAAGAPVTSVADGAAAGPSTSSGGPVGTSPVAGSAAAMSPAEASLMALASRLRLEHQFESAAALLRHLQHLHLSDLPALPDVHLPDVRRLLEDAMARLPDLMPPDNELLEAAMAAAAAATAAHTPHDVEGVDVLFFDKEGRVADIWSLREPLGCERDVLKH